MLSASEALRPERAEKNFDLITDHPLLSIITSLIQTMPG